MGATFLEVSEIPSANRPRGGAVTTPKSGRGRLVGLSLRLREALWEFGQKRSPSLDAYVIEGVDPNNVSRQLGHADVAITAKSYAKWCHGDHYVDPIPLAPNELPADLLVRVAGRSESGQPKKTSSDQQNHRLSNRLSKRGSAGNRKTS